MSDCPNCGFDLICNKCGREVSLPDTSAAAQSAEVAELKGRLESAESNAGAWRQVFQDERRVRTEAEARLASARREALEEAALIFDRRAEKNLAEAVWFDTNGKPIHGCKGWPSGPAKPANTAADRAMQNLADAQAIRSLASIEAGGGDDQFRGHPFEGPVIDPPMPKIVAGSASHRQEP